MYKVKSLLFGSKIPYNFVSSNFSEISCSISISLFLFFLLMLENIELELLFFIELLFSFSLNSLFFFHISTASSE